MKRIFLFISLLTLGFTTAQAQAAPGWSGRYIYEEDGGKTAGGTPIFIVHQLQVWKGKNGWMAHLESNGYQTYVDLIARPRPHANGQKVDFNLMRYQNGSLSFWAKPGQRLFGLQRDPKHPRRLMTIWGKFWPVTLEKKPSAGVYFRRDKAK